MVWNGWNTVDCLVMINDIDAAWCYKHLPLALGIGLWLRSCEKMAYPTCTSSLAQTPFCSQILSSTSTQTQYCTSSKFSWSPSTRLWKSLQKKNWVVNHQPSQLFLQDFCPPKAVYNLRAPTFRQPARRSFPASCIPCNLTRDQWLMPHRIFPWWIGPLRHS